MGGWVVGRVCLKIKKKIYTSSLSARSKFVLRVRVRVRVKSMYT